MKAIQRTLLIGSLLGHMTLQATAQQEKPYTLHVYANLVQIPTLILSPDLLHVPRIDRGEVLVRLDHGAPFRPTYLRREGGDPITLAILLDLSGDQDKLILPFAEAVSALASTSLQSHDRILFYGLDCRLVRIGLLHSPDTDSLHHDAHDLTEASDVHGSLNRVGSCAHSLHLNRALKQIATELSSQHGRRVIFAVTGGHEHVDQDVWNATWNFVTAAGVAIFGLSVDTPNRDFDKLCQDTGGIVRSVEPTNFKIQLARAVATLRDRYIVEFPRPDRMTSGHHHVEVSVIDTKDFIRPGGTSVAIADPCVPAGENTMPFETHLPSQSPCIDLPSPAASP